MNNNDSFRNRQNGFETMDGGAPGKKQKKGNFGKMIGIVVAVFVLAILAMNSTYQIREQEQAVLVTDCPDIPAKPGRIPRISKKQLN